MSDAFLDHLKRATLSADTQEQCRLLTEQAHLFFATPHVAQYWELVRQWDLEPCATSMPVLIQGWLAFLCGDRPALHRLLPVLSFSDAITDAAAESSMRHALHALSGLEPDPQKRLFHAEQANACLSESSEEAGVGASLNRGVTVNGTRNPVARMVLANARLTLAQVLAGQEQVRRAAAMFEEAEALFRAAAMPFPAAVACTNALLNHYRLGRHLLVLERAQRVLSDAAAFQGEEQAWWRLVRLPAGMACCELLKPAMAVAHLQDARACIDEMRLFHMHGLVEWVLFRALWLMGDGEALHAMSQACEGMFTSMHHPFLDRMMAQFRLVLADADGLPLPIADVEGFTLPGVGAGASGMWVREEMLAWLAVHGYSEMISTSLMSEVLSTLRFAGNAPRLQHFLVAQARLHLQHGETGHAETCLREGISIWQETGGAAGFVMFSSETGPHGEVALLRVLEPALYKQVAALLQLRGKQRKAISGQDAGICDTGAPVTPAGEEGSPAVHAESRYVLTSREREILQLAAQGMGNADIAKALFLGMSTVKWHINHIFSKLGAENRIQAIRIAQARGELSSHP